MATINVKSQEINQRLEYLRQELRAERLSWGEVAELQSLAPDIEADDVELLEAADVPQHPSGDVQEIDEPDDEGRGEPDADGFYADGLDDRGFDRDGNRREYW